MDLADVNIERRACGRHALPFCAPWVAYVDYVHTVERCGEYVMVALRDDWRAERLQLRVVWPDRNSMPSQRCEA